MMSPGDDDISAALPRPPLPAPARREAAIAAAIRRFDGLGEAEPAPGRPAPAASWARRPYLGALAGATLVAVIALPLAWTSFDGQPYREALKPPAEASPAAARPEPAADPAAAPPPQVRAQAPPARPDSVAARPPAAASPDSAEAAVEPAPAVTLPPLEFASPPPMAEPSASAAEAPIGEAGSDQIVVTGSRIRRPDLQSSAPLTVVDAGAAAPSRRAAASRPARRGDWNACTVEDPRRSLAGCRVPAGTADGLERAWKGDWAGAARTFDSAVAAAPRSSAAYLNRALARRRSGEFEGALADLDRAVRFSPRTARYYYHRSLVLRQLGDSVRAKADEARAVELDPRYAPLVRGH